MITYANLEVSRDGEILQSSYVVPEDGVLPYPMHSTLRSGNSRPYTEGIFSPTVEVALSGPCESLRIVAILIPPRVRGLRALRLLLPILAAATGLGAALSTLLHTTSLTDAQHMGLTALATAVMYILVGYPCAAWFRWIYFDGAPSVSARRKLTERYTSIPVFKSREAFKIATM